MKQINTPSPSKLFLGLILVVAIPSIRFRVDAECTGIMHPCRNFWSYETCGGYNNAYGDCGSILDECRESRCGKARCHCDFEFTVGSTVGSVACHEASYKKDCDDLDDDQNTCKLLGCTWSSTPPTPRPTPPPTTAPRPTTPPPTTSAPIVEFDPAKDDPNWPGKSPKSGSTHRFVINIQYDEYPEENSWVFEKYVSNATISANVTASSNDTNNTTVLSDDWVVVDEYSGDEEEGLATPGEWASHPQSNLSSDTLYRFNFTDSMQDGICCMYGKGWLTITNSSAVVWSLQGQEFNASAVAYLWVDSNGHVFLDESATSAPTSAPTVSTTTFNKPRPLDIHVNCGPNPCGSEWWDDGGFNP